MLISAEVHLIYEREFFRYLSLGLTSGDIHGISEIFLYFSLNDRAQLRGADEGIATIRR